MRRVELLERACQSAAVSPIEYVFWRDVENANTHVKRNLCKSALNCGNAVLLARRKFAWLDLRLAVFRLFSRRLFHDLFNESLCFVLPLVGIFIVRRRFFLSMSADDELDPCLMAGLYRAHEFN